MTETKTFLEIAK